MFVVLVLVDCDDWYCGVGWTVRGCHVLLGVLACNFVVCWIVACLLRALVVCACDVAWLLSFGCFAMCIKWVGGWVFVWWLFWCFGVWCFVCVCCVTQLAQRCLVGTCHEWVVCVYCGELFVAGYYCWLICVVLTVICWCWLEWLVVWIVAVIVDCGLLVVIGDLLLGCLVDLCCFGSRFLCLWVVLAMIDVVVLFCGFLISLYGGYVVVWLVGVPCFVLLIVGC